RVNPASGEITTIAQGLPPALLPVGGAIDVAFLDGVAYVLVTLVGAPFGSGVDGIYRVDGDGQFTVVADIGAFAASHPPQTTFALPQGVQYSIEAHRGGFLVADGHHNRILRVELDGSITVAHAFGNVVPTGLETWGDTVYVARAGAIPHLPEEGRILAIESRSGEVSEVASGAPLLVDVERGRGRTLFGLAQGHWSPGQMDGTPADPDTGSLVRVNDQGGFDVVATGLDRPTSLEVIGNDAYVITLSGTVLRVPDIASAPYGASSGP
ncbi:MAG TPA: ScyD/ScyE family protein, partial [Steroidobacteraceae bacterium]|nr:ScyD/ScyE family protein [Steroidobacteraceae bacterium]